MFELDDLYVADLFIHDDNYNNDMINVGFYEKDKRKTGEKDCGMSHGPESAGRNQRTGRKTC